jgi:hypothetical protein
VTFEEGSQLTVLGAVENRSEYAGWGFNIFKNTISLKTVVLPAKLELIGNSCFENSSVAEIDLNDNILKEYKLKVGKGKTQFSISIPRFGFKTLLIEK